MKSKVKEVKEGSVGGVKSALLAIMPALFLAPANAFAGGVEVAGLTSVLNMVSSILAGASIVVVTIAIMWAGYKVAFAHSSLQDIAKPFLGAILIGAASGIAAMIINAGTYTSN